MELLKTNKKDERLSGKKSFNYWIVDSSASHHTTENIELLIEVNDMSPWPVGLPNGASTYVVKEGSLFLGGSIYLPHVLFVPHMNCTLLSVGKLLNDLNCTVTFGDNLGVIQDRILRTRIGAGELCGGVYQFRIVPARMNKGDGISEQELWHRRSGNPSRKVLSSFPKIKSRLDSGDANTPYDICFRAKQTREIFAQCDNKASATFSLIHYDLWGPYRVYASCGAYYFLTIVDDFSRAIWTYLLGEKREVSDTIKNFLVMVERKFQTKVQTIRSGNGIEFMCLRKYLHQRVYCTKPRALERPCKTDELSGNIDIFLMWCGLSVLKPVYRSNSGANAC